MLIFKRLIHSASRGFPQWVELHYDDMDKLHPPWPLPPAVSGQRPVSCVPAAAAGAGRAEAHGVFYINLVRMFDWADLRDQSPH